jgi:peptidoglycan LD-endopeptidase CwlK
MYKFSERSKEQLVTCHKTLIMIASKAITMIDFSVIKGYRTEEEQEAAVKSGASKVHFPHSYHNKTPSMAFDIVPYPIDWENLQRFHDLAKVIKQVAKELEVKDLYWGYDMWRWDMPHWQLGR